MEKKNKIKFADIDKIPTAAMIDSNIKKESTIKNDVIASIEGDPQMTLFKNVHRRHTSFTTINEILSPIIYSDGRFTFEIESETSESTGNHIMGDCYLIYKCNGTLNLNKLKIIIEFQSIETPFFYYPDTDFSSKTTRNNNIYCTPIKIPVKYLPLIVLGYNFSIKIHAIFENSDIISDVKLCIDFHMLAAQEKSRFLSFNHEYLIHYPIRTEFCIDNDTEFKIPYHSRNMTHLILSLYKENGDIFTEDIDGHVLLDGMQNSSINSYRNIAAYHKLNITYKKGYWLIPFCMDYDFAQPSGFLKVNNLDVSLKLNDIPGSLSNGILKVTGFYYNVFRIMDKHSGIGFPIHNCDKIDFDKNVSKQEPYKYTDIDYNANDPYNMDDLEITI